MRCTAVCSALTGIFLFACTRSPVDVAGGSTSTPNEVVVGQAFFPGGEPAALTEVQLIPSSFTANGSIPVSDLAVDTTDAAGAYCFTGVDTGTYNIQAVHLATRKRALLTGVMADTDTVHAPSAVLEPAGQLLVILSDSSRRDNGYLLIPGTTIAAVLDGTKDTLVLDSVPAGIIPEIVVTSDNGAVAETLRYNITVFSGEAAVVSNPSWKFTRTIVLNTSATGAEISGTITDFPVCIRLHTDNFDFSQAQTGGNDIRFSTSTGTPLDYEIEKWDAAARQAVLWVKVDTIYGNDSTQSLTMYWGNPEAAGAVNSAAVFDTANGFAGVWHLNEAEGTVEDATANRYTGNRFGNQSQIEGQIASGQSYLKQGDFSDMGNVLDPGTSDLTVSAWIKFTVTGETYTIVGKSNGGEPASSEYGWLMTFSFNNFRFMIVSDGGVWGDPGTFWTEAGVALNDTASWHFVTAVIDRSGNSNCHLFIDGADVTGTQLGNITDVGTVSNPLNLRIGAEADDEYPVKSYLDEVTVSYTVRTADWVKLCYMNQRTDDRLVVFR